jgi:hypothetical protein
MLTLATYKNSKKNHYPKNQFFFPLNFLMFLQKWRSAARSFSQIWLQDKL